MCHGLAPKTFEYFAGARRIYEIGLQLVSGGRAAACLCGGCDLLLFGAPPPESRS
jgi:hypothetical protein